MKNPESKILNKAETIKETVECDEQREHDSEFARTVAERLNELVNEGALTSKSLSQASPEIIDEFIARFRCELILREKFGSGQREKIKTTFGARERPEEKGGAGTNEPAEVGAEEIKKKMKDFLADLRARQNKGDSLVTGVMLFGSRMHPRKTPWEESDLDAVFYVDRPDTLSARSYIADTYRKRGPDIFGMKNLKMHVIVERPSDLLDVFQRGYSGSVFSSLPPWVLDATSFVGELPGYNETQVNELIHNYCSSEDVKE